MKRFGSIGLAVCAAAAALVLVPAAQATPAPAGAVDGLRSPADHVLQLGIHATSASGGANLADAVISVDGTEVQRGALCSPAGSCDVGTVTLPLDTTAFPDGTHDLVITVTGADSSAGTVVDNSDFQIWNNRPVYTSTATLTVGSAVPAPAPAGGSGGPGGAVEGASAGSCTTPKLSMVLDQRPLRIHRGVPVLVAGKSYRFTGRLTCVINGKRVSAPKRTRIEARAIVHGKSVLKGRASVGSGGKIVFRLASPSSRTLEFRFTEPNGKVIRVRIKIETVHVKKQTHKKG
jgi:hypothetical protein